MLKFLRRKPILATMVLANPQNVSAPRGKHYSHVNSKGVKYYLNMKYVSLRAGELVPIYYFSKDVRKEASPLPSDLIVMENPRNGFLTVRRVENMEYEIGEKQ